MRKRMMSGNDVLLGKDGDGVALPDAGIEGRWFTGEIHTDVDIGERHY